MRAILIFFLTLLSTCYATNWQASLKNRQHLYYNTNLYLTETTGSLQGKMVKIQLKMREKGQLFFSFQKNMDWLMGLQPVSVSYFRFSKANYEVFIDIYCPETGETAALELQYDCQPLEKGIYASDIFLSDMPLRFWGEKNPILAEKVPEKLQNLHFYQEIQAPKSILTARAILYQEKKSQSNTKATTYTSLRQVNQVLSLQNGTAYFTGNFDLSSLFAGKYLIEVLIYADAQLLSEKSVRFEISQEPSFIRAENIDKSIADLVLICNDLKIKKTQGISAYLEKKQALIQIFEQRYPNEGILQAQAYFDKVAKIRQRFANEPDFWASHQVQIFSRYGEPDKIEKISFAGAEFQKWKYEKWNLLFIFEKKGDKWQEYR